MMIKLKDSRETIGATPFCKHVGSCLLPNAPNIPNFIIIFQMDLISFKAAMVVASSIEGTTFKGSFIQPYILI